MFDHHGNMTPGFHDWIADDLKRDLVDAFGAGSTRSQLHEGLTRLRSEMLKVGVAGSQWIDGSFTTSKSHPGDVDLVSLLDEDLVNALPDEAQEALMVLVSGNSTRVTHGCDSYYCPSVPEGHPRFQECRKLRTYWLGEFGFDREDRPKGIVRVLLPCPSTEDL